jgi:hypothetical protein
MTLRAAALLALAAFIVHEVRYLVVPDGHADAGHGYLAVAPVLLAGLLALALGRSLGALGRRPVPRRGLTWAAASGALLAVHVGQEGLERLLAGGGPVDAGALVVLPLCALAGAVVAAAVRRAERLLATAAAPARVPRPARLSAPALLVARTSTGHRSPAWLARRLAGRAPPAFG